MSHSNRPVAGGQSLIVYGPQPQLVRGGEILSTGQDYVSDGPLSSAIA